MLEGLLRHGTEMPVETHRANVMRKLELTSIVGLVHYVVRHQLIHP
jgi:DNA-binding CsgD family transcriptional regulator